MSGGFFILPRGWRDDPVFKDESFTEREAWVWMVEEAAWGSHERRVGGVVVGLQRGQLAGSTRHLAKVWGWTDSRVRRFIERLSRPTQVGGQNRRRIDASTDAGITVITICDYGEIQGSSSATDAPHEREPTQQRRSADANKKEDKQDKKKAPPTPSRSRGSRPAPIDTDPEEARWRMRIKSYKNSGHWDQKWGPEPNEAGCFVPSDVIAEYNASLSPHEKLYLAGKAMRKRLSSEDDYCGPTLDLVGEPVSGTTEASVTPITTATARKPTATKRRAG